MAKVHTIKFADFMDGSYKARKINPNPTLYTVSPIAALDHTIIIIGAGLLSLALLEKVFERQGNYDVAEAIHTGMRLVIPCIAFGFIWKLLMTVGAFL